MNSIVVDPARPNLATQQQLALRKISEVRVQAEQLPTLLGVSASECPLYLKIVRYLNRVPKPPPIPLFVEYQLSLMQREMFDALAEQIKALRAGPNAFLASQSTSSGFVTANSNSNQ